MYVKYRIIQEAFPHCVWLIKLTMLTLWLHCLWNVQPFYFLLTEEEMDHTPPSSIF